MAMTPTPGPHPVTRTLRPATAGVAAVCTTLPKFCCSEAMERGIPGGSGQQFTSGAGHEVGNTATAVNAQDTGCAGPGGPCRCGTAHRCHTPRGIPPKPACPRGGPMTPSPWPTTMPHISWPTTTGGTMGGPGVPVADVEVGAADRRRLHLQERLAPPPRRRHVPHHEVGAGARLHYGAHLHHHDGGPRRQGRTRAKAGRNSPPRHTVGVRHHRLIAGIAAVALVAAGVPAATAWAVGTAAVVVPRSLHGNHARPLRARRRR